MQSSEQRNLRAAIERYRGEVDAFLFDPRQQEAFEPEHLREAVMAYVQRRSKRLRPALVLLANRAVGGDERQAVPAAAAVELYHTWTLIHDDIIDADDVRRGQPTLHILGASWGCRDFALAPPDSSNYGRDLAILAGDALHGWSMAALLACAERGASPPVVLDLARRMSFDLTPRLLEGELLDVQFSHRSPGSISREDILRMMRLKTGALLAFAAVTGAALGVGRSPGEDAAVDGLGRYASLCGLAFQLQDDVLGILGTEERLGKPVGSDIRSGKATLLVRHALDVLEPSSREKLLATLGRADASREEVEESLAILRSCGAVEATRRLADEFLDEALRQLHAAVAPSSARELLEELARSMLHRDL